MFHLMALILGCNLGKKDKVAWSDLVPMVFSIVNNTPKNPLGISPLSLVYGVFANYDRPLLNPSAMMAEGTVFGSINKDSFEKLRFVIPPTEIVAAYERQAGPLDEQIRTLENQSRTLATLRDTLLPKLLSGEITIPTT